MESTSIRMKRKMTENNIFSIIILLIVMHVAEVTTFGTCEISILTMRFVEKCPEDKESWARAAEKLNCSSITADSLPSQYRTQNYIFQYHCVINHWRNATMEVCALNRTILGFCAEFNIHGAVIQDNYDAYCTQNLPPCPTSYNSAEAYKYPTCYEMTYRNRKTKSNPLKDQFISSASTRTAVNGLFFTLCLLRRTLS